LGRDKFCADCYNQIPDEETGCTPQEIRAYHPITTRREPPAFQESGSHEVA
jgi:hypothetical protein